MSMHPVAGPEHLVHRYSGMFVNLGKKYKFWHKMKGNTQNFLK